MNSMRKENQILSKFNADSTIVEVSQLCELGKVYCLLQQYHRAKSCYEAAYKLCIQMNDDNHLYITTLIFIFNDLGVVYSALNKYKVALSYYMKSSSILECAVKNREEKLMQADIFGNIANTLNSLGNYRNALIYYEKSLSIKEELLLSNHNSIAGSISNLSVIYRNIGEHNKALEFAKQALLMVDSYNERQLEKVEILNNLALVYVDLKNYNEALANYEDAISITENSLGSFHPILIVLFNNLGRMYNDMRSLQLAHNFLLRSVEIGERLSLNRNNPNLDLADTYCDLGDYYRLSNGLTNAIIFYNKSLKIKVGVLGVDNVSVAELFNHLAEVHADDDNFKEAMECITKSLQIKRKLLGNNNLEIVNDYYIMGNIFLKMGVVDKAELYLDTSLEIRKRLKDSADQIAASYNSLGECYNLSENYELSQKYFENALNLLEGMYDKQNYKVILVTHNIVNICCKKQNYIDAITYLQDILEFNSRECSLKCVKI